MIFNSRYILYIFILALGISCKNSIQQENKVLLPNGNKHALKFKIEDFDSFKIISIYNPLQNSSNIHFEYYLSNNIENIPNHIKNFTFIKTPVKNVVCLSTTHIGFIDKINETASISAVANGYLVNNEKIRNGLSTKTITDIGSDRNLNYEELIKLKPDVILAYGVGAESIEYIEKLDELNLNTILLAEYLETTPLAKTEWIKVIAALYDKEELALSIFDEIEKNYLNISYKAKNMKHKPKVLTGLPWKGIWYVPGGKSYVASIISDAGGDYLWKENNSTESIPLNFEHVFHKAQDAIWINSGAANSYQEIISVDERIVEFPVFKNKKVFNNNAIQNINGGNDYWESGIVHPELILSDLIKVFHPKLLPDYQFSYYKKLENQ
jgi:iron complex transport system substrate-binding protein